MKSEAHLYPSKYNPSNNGLYVANRDSGTVSVIDTRNNTVANNVQS